MNLTEEARDYAAAGALAEELPYWGWLPDGRTCLSRSGQLLTFGRLAPAVVDGRTPGQIDRVADRWQRALSNLDEHTRLYFYLLRRPSRLAAAQEETGAVVGLSQRRRCAFLAERVSEVCTYVAWCTDPQLKSATVSHNGSGWIAYAHRWLARQRRPHESVYLQGAIQAAARRFRQSVDASRALVDELTPIEILKPVESSRVLSELINRPGTPWDGATGSGMNWRLAVSELEAERRYLRLDGEPAILYSLLSPPGEARANLLADLYRLDATLTVSLQWRRWRLDSARRKIRSAQRHYFSKRYSMMAHVQEKEGTASAMVDSAAEAESGSARACARGAGGRWCRLWFDRAHDCVARGSGGDRAAGRDIRRIFHAHDAKVIREGYGQLPAWFGRLPAQPRSRQIRSVFASAGLAACLAPIFGPPVGDSASRHLGRPSLAVLETRWKTPYHYDLFAGDVGHTLVLGATGSGKSFMLNFLLVSALQYAPRVLILDLGGSYRWLTSFLGGGYLELSPSEAQDSVVRLRPFSLPATE